MFATIKITIVEMIDCDVSKKDTKSSKSMKLMAAAETAS